MQLQKTCKYCGQELLIDVVDATDDYEVGMKTLQACDCGTAQVYLKQEKRRENLMQDVESIIGEKGEHPQNEAVINLVKAAVYEIVENNVVSVAVDPGHGVKINVKLKSDDKISVSIKTTKQRSVEG